MDEEVDDNSMWGEGKYTNYDIWCPMAFNVTAVTFEMTLSMNKFTNTFIPTYFQFIGMPIVETKFGMICNLTNLWRNIVMDDQNLDGKSLRKW